jgi:tetratricopeptide (TPR) repeat protein
MIERVRRGDFRAPRAVNPVVHRALEAICLKAMRGRPEDRYESVKALAADVRHWLDDEPVSAYPDPLRDRVWRWIRRHRTAVTTAAGIVSVATISFAVTSVILTGYNRRLDAARVAQRANFERTLKTADDMLGWITGASLAYAPGVEEKRVEMAGEAGELYRSLLRDNPDDQDLARRAAPAFVTVAAVYRQNDVDAEAAVLFEKAMALDRALGLTIDEGFALMERGELHRMRGRLAAAEADYAAALDRVHQVRTMSGRPAPEDQMLEAQIEINQAAVYFERGTYRKAIAGVKRAVALLEQLTAPKGPRPNDWLNLVLAQINLADALREVNETAEAAEALEPAAVRVKDFFAHFPWNFDAKYLYARAREASGQIKAAESRDAAAALAALDDAAALDALDAAAALAALDATAALAALDDAVKQLTQLVRDQPKPHYRLELATALLARARVHDGRNTPAAAVQDAFAASRYIEGLRVAPAARDKDKPAWLPSRDPDRPEYRTQLARALSLLGRLPRDGVGNVKGLASPAECLTKAAALLDRNVNDDAAREADATLREDVRNNIRSAKSGR